MDSSLDGLIQNKWMVFFGIIDMIWIIRKLINNSFKINFHVEFDIVLANEKLP